MSSSGSISNTRQQLDELDELLKKMLDLPGTPGEDPAATMPMPREIPVPPEPPSLQARQIPVAPPKLMPPPDFSRPPEPTPEPKPEPEPSSESNWRIQLPAGATTPTPPPPPTVFQSWNEPQWVPGEVAEQPEPTQGGSLTVEEPPKPAPEGVPAEAVVPADEPKEAIRVPTPPVTPTSRAPSSTDLPPLSVIAWPLAAVDAMISVPLRRIGPVGRRLTSPGGKNFLGYLGVAMITAAVGWGVVDWLLAGWTW